MKEVLIVILTEYADWEVAPIAAELNRQATIEVKTVSLTKEPVQSMGGFLTLPDYTIAEAMEKDFAGLLLIGGTSWRTEEALAVGKLAQEKGAVIGAICDATVFLGKLGFLNTGKHTSNQLKELQNYAGTRYTGANHYVEKQVVRDGQLITANGTAALDFARELLLALTEMSVEEVEQWYAFCKFGYYETVK
ncbi:DJ-1/PfpI family protein [Enterococcus sp. LJL99]